MANFSFGSPAAANTTFGPKPLTGGGSFSFGGAQSTSATPGFFSTPTTSAPSFGIQNAAPPALGAFGQNPTTQPTMGFGMQSLGAFGNQTTQAATGFGQTTPAATGFGQTTPAATGFGQTAPAATGFGQTTQAFGQTTPGFGKTTTTQSGLSFGGTVSTPSTGFNFGNSTGGLSFGTAAPTLGTTPATSNLFGQKSTAPTLGLGLNTTMVQAGNKPQIGLGGVDINSTQPKAIEGKSESGKVKETQVPQEIVALVDNLKLYIKQQKEISSEIAKTSTRKLFNVANEIQTLNWSLSDISNLVDNNYAVIKTLRSDTAEAIQHAEMAQRTHETPACLQYENTAPINYFMNLVQKYEIDLVKLRGQVEVTEKHMRSLTNPQKLSSEDLKKGLNQIHESFVSLASRIHEIHQKVEDQKEQYLNLRKCLLRDKTNVFESQENKSAKTILSKVTSGPTPFSTITGINLGISLPNSNKDIWGQSSTQSSFGFKQNFGANYSGTNIGGTNLASESNDGAFSLQKPPLGIKRNKH